MRREAMIGTYLALAVVGSAETARAEDEREPPLPPLSEARPPLVPPPPEQPVPWQHHLEIGGGFALSELPVHLDGAGAPTPMRFGVAPGFHLDLSWQVIRYLRFTGYILEHDHAVEFPAESLGIPASASITGAKAHMYTFGVRFSPTLPLGSRGRLWLTAGAGWGRIEYPRYTVRDPTPQNNFIIRERAENLVEIPLGLGGSFEIIPRWLSIHVEVMGSFVPSQTGDALDPEQVINGLGQIGHVGPMPKLDAAFVETIGLSLHL
jgi:hypothetical protein